MSEIGTSGGRGVGTAIPPPPPLPPCVYCAMRYNMIASRSY